MAQHLTQTSMRIGPRRALHTLVRQTLPELPWERVAIQAAAHVRILVPGDRVSPVPLHSDFGIGHSLDERNLWIALTRARGASALHVASFEESLTGDAVRHAAGRFLADPTTHVRAVDVERGDVLLFTPLHVHGARIVEMDETRVSIDVRIAPLQSARARNAYAYIPLVSERPASGPERGTS
jgi:hypothetical protein